MTSGEQCDDGNDVLGDGCSVCVRDAFCGDTVVNGDEECDDGNTISGDGCSSTCASEITGDPALLTANWSFKNVATNTTTGCPTGFDTAAVVSQPIDANGAPVGSPTIDLLTCADATGTVELDPGLYRVHIVIRDNAGTVTYASTLAATVDLSIADQTFTAEIVNDGGYFAFAWQLMGATSNQPLTCADVTDIDGVEIISTLSGSTDAVTDVFTCADGAGVTAAILAGSYTISVSALNAQNQALGAPHNEAARVIQAPNQVTDLGTLTLAIDGQ